MKQSPTRVLLIILFVFLGCFGVAYGASGMLTALPAPAIGGTCGPSTASETALEALVEPGSIGAGVQPPRSNVTAHSQWQTFIQQCQDLADRRGLASLAIVVTSLAVSGAGLFWLLRKRGDGDGDAAPTDDGRPGRQQTTPYGFDDPAALVGAGAVVGSTAPMTTWSPYDQPGYSQSPPFAGQAIPPPYPGAYPVAGYPPPAWPGQPQGYPPDRMPDYPPAPVYPPSQAYPPAPVYPSTTGYPIPQAPTPTPAPEQPGAPTPQPPDSDDQGPGHRA